MNRVLHTYLILAGVAISAVSCSLDEELYSYDTRETYYTNETEIRSGLDGCYLPMRQIFGSADFFLYSEASTDIMYLNNSSFPAAVCDYSPSFPSIVANMWQRGYIGVMRANAMTASILRSIDKGYITEKQGLPFLAEAAIMRAMYYYLLTSIYGDVPFYTEEVTAANRQRIASLPRMSAHDTRNALVDELMEYLMPANHPQYPGQAALKFMRTYDSGTEYRVGAAVGLMLAGKLAMWEERWDEAIAAYGVIEDIYGNGAGVNPVGALAAYPLSDIPFSCKYTSESIWELAYAYSSNGLQVPGVLATYTTPTRSTITIEGNEIEEGQTISDIYNGISIPELGTTARLSVPVRPTKYYFYNLMTYYSGDRRRAEYDAQGNSLGSSGNLAWQWMGYDPQKDPNHTGSRQLLFFTSVGSANGYPWLGNKFWCYGMIYNRDSNNPKIFRYATALLDLAEAWARKGDLAKACEYINATRSRAGLPLFTVGTFSNVEVFLEQLVEENARELFGEFQRRFQLVRWGIWYERTKAYSNSSLLQTNIRPWKEYLPIPADQITYSGGALDNDAYIEN